MHVQPRGFDTNGHRRELWWFTYDAPALAPMASGLVLAHTSATANHSPGTWNFETYVGWSFFQ